MKRLPFGPTGQYPHGKARPDDKGELASAITAKDGMVILDFFTSVTWLALSPSGARALAVILNRKADEADKQKPEQSN